MIGVTRNLELGGYLRTCMDLVNVDGYMFLKESRLWIIGY